MAEAAVQTPTASKFFCHKCTQEIHPVLPDYVCPRCQCGFIEELSQEHSGHSEESDDFDAVSHVVELWNFADILRRRVASQNQVSQDENQHNSSTIQPPLSVPSSSQRSQRGGSRAALRRQSFESWGPPGEGFLQQLIATLAEGRENFPVPSGFPVLLTLHGNPGDYVWGRGSFDAVISQLLNQLDGTGPPPLPKDKIAEIPTVHITQEQVDKNLQCTVCMEDFHVAEPVKQLSCEHQFHSSCIIPWLELHGTCPICRKLLNDDRLPSGFNRSSFNQENNYNESSNNRSRRNQMSSNTNTHYNNHSPSVYDFTDDLE